MKRGQQRQTPFGTGLRICAYPDWGYCSSVLSLASPIQGNLHPAFGFFFRCLGAKGHDVLTPRPTYFKLRETPPPPPPPPPLGGFVMLSFTMYDGSTDPYYHMLHFNQTMILSGGNDHLLCKVFPASLKGPALA